MTADILSYPAWRHSIPPRRGGHLSAPPQRASLPATPDSSVKCHHPQAEVVSFLCRLIQLALMSTLLPYCAGLSRNLHSHRLLSRISGSLNGLPWGLGLGNLTR